MALVRYTIPQNLPESTGNLRQRAILRGNLRLEEKWSERHLDLIDIDLLWFTVQMTRQLRTLAQARLDEIQLADPDGRIDLILYRENDLLIVKDLLAEPRQSIRFDFKEFRQEFRSHQNQLWQDLLSHYPNLTEHPDFDASVRHFR